MSNKSATRCVFRCLVVAIAVCSWTVGRAADDTGERLYEGHCRPCHGAEGRGTQAAPSLVPFKWSDEEALELIRHPLCDMPPIPPSAVSDAEVAQIVAYLKAIKQPPNRRYSIRSATTGSTRAARRAGSQTPKSATR
jgi:mono/diheme cytochrome c family protein